MSLSYSKVPVVKGIDPRINFGQPVAFEAEACPTNVRYQTTSIDSYSDTSLSVSVSIPSKSVAVARVAYIKVQFTVTFTCDDNGTPCLQLGSNDGPRAFPFHQVCNNSSVNLGNQTFSSDVKKVLDSLLRQLSHEDLDRYCSGCPAMLDQYPQYSDSGVYGNQRNPLAPFGSNSYYTTRGGFPITVNSNTNTAASVTFTTFEPLLVEPFALNTDVRKAFLGLDRINFQFNLSNLSRVWSHSSSGRILTGISATISSSPEIHMIYLSTNLFENVPSPLNWSVESQDFYESPSTSLASGASTTINLSNININSVPYMFIISSRQILNDRTHLTSDTYNRLNSISFAFKNRQGLLSDCSTEDLYQISRKNGLNMSFSEWKQWGGSVLYLRPEDFGLEPLEVPSSLQNTQFSLSANVTNISSSTQVVSLNCVIVSQGMITVDDSGLVTWSEGLLSQQDVLNLANAPFVESTEVLHGSGFFSKLGKAFKSIGRHVWKLRKPISSVVKPFLPGPVSSGLSAVGLGKKKGKKMGKKMGKSRRKKGGVLIGGCDDCYDDASEYSEDEQATDLNNYIRSY